MNRCDLSEYEINKKIILECIFCENVFEFLVLFVLFMFFVLLRFLVLDRIYVNIFVWVVMVINICVFVILFVGIVYCFVGKDEGCGNGSSNNDENFV